MPPRRQSSINTTTAPLPPQSPSKIPRRKSVVNTSSTTTTRRQSTLPTPTERITPRNSLAEEELPRETPYAAVFLVLTTLIQVEKTRQ